MEKRTEMIVKGVRSSKEEYSGASPEFKVITYEVDGITYNRIWDNDMIMEPWFIDFLLDDVGYPEDMQRSIIKNYCLGQIKMCDISPITKVELEENVACFSMGWDAHKDWEAEQMNKKV